MKALHILRILAAVAAVACCVATVHAQPANKEAAAEAALTNCELEKSLKLWREILAVDPDHKRAKFVVARLTVQALDLDTHLDVIATLLDKGVTRGVTRLLDAASARAATDAQKACILYLGGRLAYRTSDQAAAQAGFESAVKLYAHTEWGARSAIALAEKRWDAAVAGEPQRLLRAVTDDARLPAAVREEAGLKLLLVESRGWTPQRRIAGLRRLLARFGDAGVKRQVLGRIADTVVAAQGKWTADAVEAVGAVFQTNPPREQAAEALRKLAFVAARSQDAAALDAVLKVLAAAAIKDKTLALEAAFLRAQAVISRAIVERDKPAMKRLLADADRALRRLEAGAPSPSATKRIWELRGRRLLAEAQKLLALAGPAEALPALVKAKDHYLTALPADPAGCLRRLASIGKLLEHVREWETAAALYREVADSHPHTAQARDALMNVARLHELRLNDPATALEVYAEYAGRYPAELPYRQMRIGERLRRLGYSNVLDFQKRTGLKPDGLVGPATRNKLDQIEASFDVIRVGRAAPPPGSGRVREASLDLVVWPENVIAPGPSTPAPSPGREVTARDETPSAPRIRVLERKPPGVLRGSFVHPKIYAIARRLQREGRHHEAVRAYRLFLNLFPTKRHADDALLAVARIFRDNFLFAEALGAYTELMEYFPKGDQTSEAYVESAACLENLGRWKEARELYELYAKKFPKYKHVGLCRKRLKLLDEIAQYQQFIDGNPASPKAPEAQYQIAVLLYKQLGNNTKAAVEFTKVAAKHPRHVRAADGLFTAGAAHLRMENFPAARKAFAELAAKYRASRLADDAQYWIGHTYEYEARAVGKLDDKRIILRRRTGRGRDRLLADVALRRKYNPGAVAGPELPRDIWTADTLGVLTSGSKRDRVNADLFRAIAAYRLVAKDFKMGDMAGAALHRVGVIYTQYLKDPAKGFAAYQELLAQYPGTKQAIDALYEVGAYHLKNRKFDQAVKSYQQFVYNYPNDKRVEDAMLAVARAHMETKTYDKALDAYQSYLSKYPAGRHAAFAKAQVNWIRTYHY